MYPLDIISLIIASQGYFLLLLMASLSYRPRIAKTLLQTFVAVKSTQMLALYLLYEDMLPPVYAAVALNIGVMTAPLLYLYVKAMVSREFRFRPLLSLHFLPAIVFPALLIVAFDGNYPVAYPHLEPGWPWLLRLYNLLTQVWLMTYLFLAMRLLPDYERFIRGHFSSISDISFAWLYKVLAITLLIYAALVLVRLWGWYRPDQVDYRWLIAVQISMQALFFYFIAVGGYHQQQAPDLSPDAADAEVGPAAESDGSVSPEIKERKYQRSSLSEEEAKNIWQRLTEYLYEKEPFLDSELRLGQLAEALGVSSQSLSQVINTFAGQNFYDLINGYRARKAKVLLESDEYTSRSILFIAHEAGFSNKVTFYKHFRKHFDMNPTGCRKACR